MASVQLVGLAQLRSGLSESRSALVERAFSEVLAPAPEVDRVHGVTLGALVFAGGRAYADLADAPVEDVGAVAATAHPPLKDVGRGPLGTGSSGDVLGGGAPVVAVTFESTPDIAVPQVVLLYHAGRVRAGRLGELGMRAQWPQAPARAFVIVQPKRAFLLCPERYPRASAGPDGGGRRPHPLRVDGRATNTAVPAKITAPRTTVAYLMPVENPLLW